MKHGVSIVGSADLNGVLSVWGPHACGVREQCMESPCLRCKGMRSPCL